MVFVTGTGEQNDSVTAIDWPGGKVAWTFQTDGNIEEPPLYSDGVLYVTNGNQGVYALEAETGRQFWKAYPGMDFGASAPAVAAGSVIVTGSFGTQGFVYAISGDGDSAALDATPAASFDISGLPPCEPIRDLPVLPVEGTPASSLGTPESSQMLGVEISPDDVLTGQPATPEDVAAITETLRAMAHCNRADTQREVLSFYSDDYFRRPGATYDEQGQPVARPGVYLAIIGSEESQVLSADGARQSEDGRIGFLFMLTESYGQFVIFDKQGDHWLVDETLQIVPVPGGGKG